MELVGLILPPIIDLVNRFIKDTSVRFLVAFLVCALIGVFLNWLATGLLFVDRLQAFQSISSSILAVFGASQITYNLGYEDSELQKTIDPRVATEGGDR